MLHHLLSLSLLASALADGPYSVRLFVRNAKGTFNVNPLRETQGGLVAKGVVATYQPNVLPALGVSGEIGPYLGWAFSRGVSAWRQDERTKGRSTTTHYELHSATDRWGIDLHRQDYRGFFLKQVRAGELSVFGDAGLGAVDPEALLPEMTWRSMGLSLYHVFSPDDFSVRTAILQKARATTSGWSPLAMLRFDETSVANPDPILPAATLRSVDASHASLSGARLSTLSVLPGVGGLLTDGTWFASAATFWGFAVQDHRLRGVDVVRHNVIGSAIDLRGAVGWNDAQTSAGLVGYKNVASVPSTDVGVTHSISLVEAFVGHRL